jgi:hypothetical protein
MCNAQDAADRYLFFTGNLIQRFGVLPIIITGAAIEFGCALVNSPASISGTF